MARATQFNIGWGMIAIAIIGYFCAFPELAVLLGIFVAAILFVSPVFVAAYFALRFFLRDTPRHGTSSSIREAASSASTEGSETPCRWQISAMSVERRGLKPVAIDPGPVGAD